MSDLERRIANNLAEVRERIAEAAQRSGRAADAVRLVAVTKYVAPKVAAAVVAAGCQNLGESRPQELWTKARALSGAEIRWHLIGHLQRNKIHRTLGLTSLLHSLDSARLLEAIHAEAAALGRRVEVLVEVNISGDTNKTGVAPGELALLLEQSGRYERVIVRGLMGMASLTGDLSGARSDFARLRELRDRVLPTAPANAPLTELSMGMSGDYEVAIEEGATIVRVGSSLFKGLDT